MKIVEESQYTRMIKLGEWLETFFDPGITSRDLSNLAEKAIQLLMVDYKLPEDEISAVVFRNIDENKYDPGNSLINNTKELTQYFIEKIKIDHYKSRKKYDKAIISKKVEQYKPIDLWVEKQDQWIELLKNYFLYFFTILSAREDSLKTLSSLSKSTIPWDLAFPSYLKSSSIYDMGNPELGVRQLVGTYDCINEKYVIKGNTLVKVLRFYESPDYKTVYEELFNWIKQYTSAENTSNPSFDEAFPWIGVLSNILFRFLELGGQGYSGVCDRCHKFFIVQRKGRKQYCSTICRVRASQQRRKVSSGK